jgi:hypothetical protein
MGSLCVSAGSSVASLVRKCRIKIQRSVVAKRLNLEPTEKRAFYLSGTELAKHAHNNRESQRMKVITQLAVGLAMLSASITASAVPVAYHLEFTATSGEVVTTTFGDSGATSTTTYSSAVGRTYYGSFAVDSDVLLTDGIGKYGELEYFFIQMEWNVWGYNLPADNSLQAFRGPSATGSCSICLGASSPGFDVVNGEIANLRGGVYGAGDIPFVDFSLGGAGTFSALGLFPYQPGETRSRVGTLDRTIQGTMKVYRVAEPPTLSILALGLALLAFVRRSLPKKVSKLGLLGALSAFPLNANAVRSIAE